MARSQASASSESLQSLLVPPRHQANPYPYFARLRAEDPVHRSPGGFWILTRYRDVEAVLRDGRFGPVDRRAEEPPDPEVWPDGRDWYPELERRCRRSAEVRAATIGLSQLWLTNLEPPRHPILRRLLRSDFSAAAIDGWRPRIREIADELLDGVARELEFDVMSRFAVPLPAFVICEMIGFPRAERERLIGWARALAPAFAGDSRPGIRRAASAATLALAGYFDRWLRSRGDLREGTLGALLATAVEDGSLAPRDAVAQCLLLLFAGHETTSNLLGNGLVALLRHPDQLHRLRIAGHVPPPAIEELLRYDSPVQFTLRVARREVAIEDRTIAAGDHVALGLAAANRDPERFSDPDRLDLARDPNPHLGFGAGRHYCLGSRLARVEAEVAVAALLRSRPRLALAGHPPAWTAGGLLRGLESLRLVSR